MVEIKLVKSLSTGLLSYIPGFKKLQLLSKRRSTHSASNAMFCYTFWLSMLKYLNKNNIHFERNRIGELGTAGSMGIGLCALLTGTREYYALEIEDLYNIQRNIYLLDDLVGLFRKEKPISLEFKQLNIPIENSKFPSELVTPLYNDDHYVEVLRNNIIKLKDNNKINYILDWQNKKIEKLDFIFSRAVMEHVHKPEEVYAAIYCHLKTSGIMLHDIELHSHGITKTTFGHRRIPSYVWKAIQGKKTYSLNRHTFDMHTQSMSNMFNIVSEYEKLHINESDNECVKEPVGVVIVARKIG